MHILNDIFGALRYDNMAAIRKINELNQKELEANISDSGSWHYEYKDTSYIFIGNIPTSLTEEDLLKIFSQYGIPTHINLIKDRETGESRGFCYMKYEDYRSCILAIDNFNGIQIKDRRLKVDHVYYYLKDNQSEDDFKVDYSIHMNQFKAIKYEGDINTNERKAEKKLLEPELNNIEINDDLQDPMVHFKSDGVKRTSAEIENISLPSTTEIKAPKKMKKGSLKFKSN